MPDLSIVKQCSSGKHSDSRVVVSNQKVKRRKDMAEHHRVTVATSVVKCSR